MERLLANGALDVHYVPVYMKKNRPAYVLCVLCAEEHRQELEAIIFAETTTIGIRRQRMERTVLGREAVSCRTSLGTAECKVIQIGTDRQLRPEYESVAEIARKHQIPFREAFRQIEMEVTESQP